MRTIIRNLIRRFVPRTDREAGFTLLELVVAAAAFTIICAGVTTMLITALRIEKYTADNTQYRETVRMVRAYVKDQAGNGIISVSDDGKSIKLGSSVILKCINDEKHEGKIALVAGGSTVADNLESSTRFDELPAGDKLLTMHLYFSDSNDSERNKYDISIYCPLN